MYIGILLFMLFVFCSFTHVQYAPRPGGCFFDLMPSYVSIAGSYHYVDSPTQTDIYDRECIVNHIQRTTVRHFIANLIQCNPYYNLTSILRCQYSFYFLFYDVMMQAIKSYPQQQIKTCIISMYCCDDVVHKGMIVEIVLLHSCQPSRVCILNNCDNALMLYVLITFREAASYHKDRQVDHPPLNPVRHHLQPLTTRQGYTMRKVHDVGREANYQGCSQITTPDIGPGKGTRIVYGALLVICDLYTNIIPEYPSIMSNCYGSALSFDRYNVMHFPDARWRLDGAYRTGIRRHVCNPTILDTPIRYRCFEPDTPPALYEGSLMISDVLIGTTYPMEHCECIILLKDNYGKLFHNDIDVIYVHCIACYYHYEFVNCVMGTPTNMKYRNVINDQILFIDIIYVHYVVYYYHYEFLYHMICTSSNMKYRKMINDQYKTGIYYIISIWAMIMYHSNTPCNSSDVFSYNDQFVNILFLYCILYFRKNGENRAGRHGGHLIPESAIPRILPTMIRWAVTRHSPDINEHYAMYQGYRSGPTQIVGYGKGTETFHDVLSIRLMTTIKIKSGSSAIDPCKDVNCVWYNAILFMHYEPECDCVIYCYCKLGNEFLYYTNCTMETMKYYTYYEYPMEFRSNDTNSVMEILFAQSDDVYEMFINIIYTSCVHFVTSKYETRDIIMLRIYCDEIWIANICLLLFVIFFRADGNTRVGRHGGLQILDSSQLCILPLMIRPTLVPLYNEQYPKYQGYRSGGSWSIGTEKGIETLHDVPLTGCVAIVHKIIEICGLCFDNKVSTSWCELCMITDSRCNGSNAISKQQCRFILCQCYQIVIRHNGSVNYMCILYDTCRTIEWTRLSTMYLLPIRIIKHRFVIIIYENGLWGLMHCNVRVQSTLYSQMSEFTYDFKPIPKYER